MTELHSKPRPHRLSRLTRDYVPAATSLVTFSSPISNVHKDPFIKFNSISARPGMNTQQKKLLTLTPSQLNLYKHTTVNPKRVTKVEDQYMRYVSGALDKGSLTLDTGTVNKVLKKQRDLLIIEKPPIQAPSRLSAKPPSSLPKIKPPVSPIPKKKKSQTHMTKSKIVSERRKVVTMLNSRWEKMEGLRIRILIDIKSLKGFHDFLASLKKENTRLNEIYRTKTSENTNESRGILAAIEEMELKLEKLNKDHEHNIQVPIQDLRQLKQTCKKKIKEAQHRSTKLQSDLDACDVKLETLKPFQDASFAESFEVKVKELALLRISNQRRIEKIKTEHQKERELVLQRTSSVAERISERTLDLMSNTDKEKLAYIKSVSEVLDKDFKGHEEVQANLDAEIKALRTMLKSVKFN